MKKNWKRRILSLLMVFSLCGGALMAAAEPRSNNICPIIESGKIYRIKNVASGKYLTMALNTNANDVNAVQKSYDGTLSQQFRLVYDYSLDGYRIYPMTSANGNGRVLTAVAPLGLENGCNVAMREVSDTDKTQRWIMRGRSPFFSNELYIRIDGLNLYANSGDGSQYGTGSDSSGNVYISSDGEKNAQWVAELVNGTASLEPGVYKLRNRGSDIGSKGSYLAYDPSEPRKLSVSDSADDIYKQWQILYLGNGMYEIRPMADTSKVLMLPPMTAAPYVGTNPSNGSNQFYLMKPSYYFSIAQANSNGMSALYVNSKGELDYNDYLFSNGSNYWEPWTV